MESLLLDLLPGISKGIRQARRELLSSSRHRLPTVITGEPGTGRDHAAALIHRLAPAAGPGAAFVKIDMGDGRQWESLDPDVAVPGTYYLDGCRRLNREQKALVKRLARNLAKGGGKLILSLTVTPVEEGQTPPPPLPQGEAFSCILLEPLRRRREDIPLLMSSLCRRHEQERALQLDACDMEYLYTHPWPRNLSELWEWMEVRLLCGREKPRSSLGKILDREIDEWVGAMIAGPGRTSGLLKKMTGQVEKMVIRAVLTRTRGNQVESAARLGINRNTLAQKIKQHGLSAAARRRNGREA